MENQVQYLLTFLLWTNIYGQTDFHNKDESIIPPRLGG